MQRTRRQSLRSFLLAAELDIVSRLEEPMFAKLFRKDTPVREACFRMTLPGPWAKTFIAETEVWNFNTPAEQITVSVQGLSGSPVSAERLALLQKFVVIRRQAELNVAPGAQLGEVVTASLGNVHLARYEGAGPEPTRHFTCLVMLNTSVLGTFYYEASGLSIDAFHERGRAAFNSIQLAEAIGG